MSGPLLQLRAAGVLSPLDVQLAHRLVVLGGKPDPTLELVIALLSRHVAQGHVCLPLADLAAGKLDSEADAGALPRVELSTWLAALRASPLVERREPIETGEHAVAAAGPALEPEPTEGTPLVLDHAGRLYLRRYFEHERAVAAQVQRRIAAAPPELDEELLAAGLTRYFGLLDPSDQQRVAAETALRRRFSLISGGPGTGKTSTVVKILALIIEQALARGERVPRMRLMAPTGKAAVRLVESIRSARELLRCSDEVRAAIPLEVSTIHRALNETRRIAGADALERPKPLAADVVLVDESSMVDLTLMARLFAAIPPAARVILLGDKDQLASVEAGAVLGDLCGVGLADELRAQVPGVVELTRSYRYKPDSGIARLARAIQAGDADSTLELLHSSDYPDVSLHDEPGDAELGPLLAASVLRGYAPYLELTRSEPAEALACFERFRVLCAHRRGPRGVERTNRAIGQLLFEHGLVGRAEGHYVGRPLLVTQNDYRNKLWNGDVGLIGADPDALERAARSGLGPAASKQELAIDARGAEGSARALCAWFLAADGPRTIGLSRLPPYESAYALSVHKSQGSEVDEVAVVLPRDVSPILTRELLYTAVTRARSRVAIHAPLEVLRAAVRRNVARSSGLSELLYRASPSGIAAARPAVTR